MFLTEGVVGSSPTGGATESKSFTRRVELLFSGILIEPKPASLCFGRRIAAVNWLKRCHRLRREEAMLEQEETRSLAKRSKRAGRLCF